MDENKSMQSHCKEENGTQTKIRNPGTPKSLAPRQSPRAASPIRGLHEMPKAGAPVS